MALCLPLAPLVGVVTLAVVEWLDDPRVRLHDSLTTVLVKAVLYWPIAVVIVGGCAGLCGAIGARVAAGLAAGSAPVVRHPAALGSLVGGIVGVLVGAVFPWSGIGRPRHWLIAGGVAGIVSGAATTRRIARESSWTETDGSGTS